MYLCTVKWAFSVVKCTMDIYVVISLRDFSVTGHRGVGQVANRVNRHRNTVSDAVSGDEWDETGRVVIGDYLIVLVTVEKMRKRGLPR